MLLECGHCGAPLNVAIGQQTYRCRYCGHASRIAETRQLMPQTPAQWQPPQRWRPPPHVPADSNLELRYQPQASSAANVIVVMVVVMMTALAGGVAAFATARKGVKGSPFSTSSFDPAAFDAVKFTETSAQMQQKLGGTPSDTYLNVPMTGLFDYAVFSWDKKDPSHPISVSMHKNKAGCTTEHEAARARLRKRLGARFDGKNWYWGGSYFSFDEECSSIGMHASLSSSPVDLPGDWKKESEAMWAMIRIDVFGRPGKLSATDTAGYLARGYDLDTVSKAVSKSTVDDASSIGKQFPGSHLRKIIGLDIEIPVDHPRFATVKVNWNNAKAGGVSGIDLSGFNNKIKDHIGMAQCLAPKMGAKLEIRETDYVNKKSDASLSFKGGGGSVTEYGVHIYASGFNTLKSEPIESLLSAAAACE